MTRTILLPQVKTQDTENGIIRTLKSCAITIPSNVVDENYFIQAVQVHVFSIAVTNTAVDLKLSAQKLEKMKADGKTDSHAYSKAQDKHNELVRLQNLLHEEWNKLEEVLNEEYENAQEFGKIALNDNFARVYAWVLGGFKSRKIWKSGDDANKGKVEEIQFHFKNEDKIIGLLKDFDFSTTQEQKKASAKQIELLANELFATDGGEIYKNISYKFTVNKINSELYTRFKRLYSHDGKGNIKDLENTAFDLCKQLYFMCLIQLKVPTINGQKVLKIEEVNTCKNPITLAGLKRKSK